MQRRPLVNETARATDPGEAASDEGDLHPPAHEEVPLHEKHWRLPTSSSRSPKIVTPRRWRRAASAA